jgi:hypothetical protein
MTLGKKINKESRDDAVLYTRRDFMRKILFLVVVKGIDPES